MTLNTLAAHVGTVVGNGRCRHLIRHICTAVMAASVTCFALTWWQALDRVQVDPTLWAIADLLPIMLAVLVPAGVAGLVQLWLDTGPYAYDRYAD